MLRDLVSNLRDRLVPDKGLREVSRQVYGAVVAQSRDPRFYLDHGFPDTVTGRFDVLCLHVFLVANRLAGEADGEARRLSQAVFDCFSAETDRALREIGIGDSSVPKRKKKLLHGFYGQVAEFAGPLGDGDAARLALAVSGRFGLRPEEAGRLARYMIAARERLRERSLADIRAGSLAFPEPGSATP
jgi:cytochrome b pre-mRNA-processing protein 3